MKLARVLLTAILLCIPLGIAAGAVFGAAILSFGSLIGRSGNSPGAHVGEWSIEVVWLGFVYGGLLGAIVTPIAYVTLVRKIGLRKALLPAVIGTLVGGLVGAIADPWIAVLTGVGGFFGALNWAVKKALRSKQLE